MTLSKTLLLLTMTILPLQTPAQIQTTLLPLPAKLTLDAGQLPLTTAFTVATPHFHDARLNAAILRTLHDLNRHVATPDAPTAISTEILTTPTATLLVDVTGPGQPIQSIDESESYTLTITPTAATLHAATTVGAMRGLTTLEQLVQTDSTHAFFTAIHIEDTPRFRWRGLHIDAGRHFIPVEVIKRNLDGMAAVKLNVFHWHLSEDQGFRVESKLFPRLTALGSDGLFYTQNQVRDIVAYAYARGIRVVPEFDMPGHTRAWFVGYPDLASGPGPYTIRREFGIDDAAIDPTRDSTYKFLDAFIGEMAGLFPDPYFHVGGDESNGKQWKANPRIVTFMRSHNLKDTDALQVYFNQRLLPIVQKYKKHMVGWDEVLHPGLPKDVVIQSWRGTRALVESTTLGYQGILSQPYYLDGMKSSKENYLADPIPIDTTLTPAQQAFILGGEACMWAEHVNAITIDSRIWPRTAAIAERFWSPQASTTDVDDMYRRLDAQSIRLEAVGLTHLSHEAVALRRFLSTDNPQALAPLTTFASALEPISFGERYRQQHTNQFTPLNSLVDAIRPDPPSRHEIARLTRLFLTAPTLNGPDSIQARAALETYYKAWLAASPAIQSTLTTSPALNAALPRARQLATLSTIALEAIHSLSTSTPPPTGWKQQSLATLEAAKKPSALVRLTFIAPLTDLINAVP